MAEAEFHDVVDALKYAFKWEAELIYAKTTALRIKGTNPMDETLQDKIRHGLIIKAFALEHMGTGQKNVIVAEYTRPKEKSLEREKDLAYKNLATLYINGKRLPEWFVVDRLKWHLGGGGAHDRFWLRRALGVSMRTIDNWSMEIRDFAYYWRERALTTARMNLYRSGHLL